MHRAKAIRCGRVSPYAASKAAGDLLALAYHTTYSAPVVITRGSNTYGPNQFPEKIVPLFITNLLDGRRVPVYGDGLQIRDWLYVEDHARGILDVLERGETGSVYNVAGGTPMTNMELTRLLVEGCGRTRSVTSNTSPTGSGTIAATRSIARGCTQLGWRPRVHFAEGIAATIDWYGATKPGGARLRKIRDYYRRQYAERGPP